MLSGDVHSPAAFFFFFAFILHIHIFYFKVAHKELLVGGTALIQLKVAMFSSVLIPFCMLVIGQSMKSFGDADIYTMIDINMHVIVEYVVTFSLAVYIFSFRNDARLCTLSSRYNYERSYDGGQPCDGTSLSDTDIFSPLLS